MTGRLTLKSIHSQGATSIALSSEPRRLRGGGVLFLQNGIASKSGAVYTHEHKLVVSHHDADEFFERRLLRNSPRFLPQIANINEPLASFSAPEFNYFHWMYEVLPKIHLLQMIHRGSVKLYLHLSNALQTETLSALGIESHQIVNSATHPFVAAPELLVPYLVGPLGSCRLISNPENHAVVLGNTDGCVGVANWMCQYLREAFLDTGTNQSHNYSRIYITRSDAAKGRRIKDENLFIAQLRKRGFETVSLTGMHYRTQIDIFKTADVIIAPHGAGLTNLTFCKPGAICIEVFGPSYISDLYAVLSELVSVRYSYMIGNGHHDSQTMRSNRDIELDADAVNATLDRAGVG